MPRVPPTCSYWCGSVPMAARTETKMPLNGCGRNAHHGPGRGGKFYEFIKCVECVRARAPLGFGIARILLIEHMPFLLAARFGRRERSGCSCYGLYSLYRMPDKIACELASSSPVCVCARARVDLLWTCGMCAVWIDHVSFYRYTTYSLPLTMILCGKFAYCVSKMCGYTEHMVWIVAECEMVRDNKHITNHQLHSSGKWYFSHIYLCVMDILWPIKSVIWI